MSQNAFVVNGPSFGGEQSQGGFQVTFDNGITVSVQFRDGNYSDGGKTVAEIAAFVDAGFIHIPGFDYGGDDVLGHCTPVQVAEFMYVASKNQRVKEETEA